MKVLKKEWREVLLKLPKVKRGDRVFCMGCSLIHLVEEEREDGVVGQFARCGEVVKAVGVKGRLINTTMRVMR